MGKAKVINLILNDGTLNGVVSVKIENGLTSSYVAPKDCVEGLIEQTKSIFGVYLLLGPNKVYVGQSSDLSRRIKQHIQGKDWWERTVVITTSDDSLDKADIDYLESELIKIANETNSSCECENKNIGNPQKISDSKKIKLDEILEDTVLLLEVLGIDVLSVPRKSTKKPAKKLTKKATEKPRITEGKPIKVVIKNKSDAISYIKESGLKLAKDVTYASFQAKKNSYWANPNINYVKHNWSIVLNDTENQELIVLQIPKNSIPVSKGTGAEGVRRRIHNGKELLRIELERESLIEKESKIDFSKFVLTKIRY